MVVSLPAVAIISTILTIDIIVGIRPFHVLCHLNLTIP